MIKTQPHLIPAHGGYRDLKSFQHAELVYDATVKFCDRFIDRRSRTHDQMVQAARSGRQNIAEGSQASGTSKKTELKLVGVARASLEELLLDYEDFLRHRGLGLWGKNHPTAQVVRGLAYEKNRTYMTYRIYIEESSPEIAANTVICLIHQTNYLLDQQLRNLEKTFLEEGGFTERYTAKERKIGLISHIGPISYKQLCQLAFKQCPGGTITMTLVRRTIAVLAITIAGVVGVNGQTTTPTPQTTTTTQQTTQTTTPPDYVFPTREERFKRYVKDTVGPWPLARAAASAGIQQWQDSPEEWGQGAEGYGKRFVSNMGRNAIRQTVTYGLDSALGLDTGFQKSKREGFFPRFKDALIQNVTSRTKSGKRVVSVPRFAGVYTGSIVAAETWYPDRYSYKDGFRSGTTTLLYGFGINVVREFLFNW